MRLFAVRAASRSNIHELSIPAADIGDVRRGGAPRPKISTRTMRPPQQGQALAAASADKACYRVLRERWICLEFVISRLMLIIGNNPHPRIVLVSVRIRCESHVHETFSSAIVATDPRTLPAATVRLTVASLTL